MNGERKLYMARPCLLKHISRLRSAYLLNIIVYLRICFKAWRSSVPVQLILGP